MGGLSLPQVSQCPVSLGCLWVVGRSNGVEGAFLLTGRTAWADAGWLSTSEFRASSSRSSSVTASSRFSGGLVKYTSAHRPMLSAKIGFTRGLSSGRGRARSSSERSVELANRHSPQTILDERPDFL